MAVAHAVPAAAGSLGAGGHRAAANRGDAPLAPAPSAVSATQVKPVSAAAISPTQVKQVSAPQVGAVAAATAPAAAVQGVSGTVPAALASAAPQAAPRALARADSITDLNTAVNQFFDSVANWLSSFTGNPLAEFTEGALLLVRRSLFNQTPIADAVQQVGLVENGGGQIAGVIEATDLEGDRLTYKLATAPRFGTVEVNADGTYLYTPDDDPATVSDNFSVTVSDRGFNLLMPFASRATAAQAIVGGSYSQGFKVVNLTNSVVWLTGIQPDFSSITSRRGWSNTCEGKSFCNGMSGVWSPLAGFIVSDNPTDGFGDRYNEFRAFGQDRTGTTLNPGDSMTINLAYDTTVWLNFFAPDLAPKGGFGFATPTWRVQAHSVYSDGASYVRLCTTDGPNGGCGTPDAMRQYKKVGSSAELVPWDTGFYNQSGPGVVSYAQGEEGGLGFGRTLLLVGSQADPSLQGAPWTAGRSVTIGPDTTFTTTAPKWCPECKDVAPVNALQVFQNFLALGGYSTFGGTYQPNNSYSKTFKTSYRNVRFQDDVQSYTASYSQSGGNAPLVIDNPTPSKLSSSTYDWTVTAVPQAPADNPWWQTYAAAGAGKLAQLLIGKIPLIGESISEEVGKVVEGAFTPAEVPAPKSISGKTTLAPLPYSIATISTGVSSYDVTGDMAVTVAKCDQGGSTRCSNYSFSEQIKSGDVITYAFTGMSWNVVPKNPQYRASIIQVPNGPTNQALQLKDEDTQKSRPTYKVGGDYDLALSAFIGDGAGVDWSRVGCESEGQVNCTTFTVSDPSVARVEVVEGQAVLEALKATKVTSVTQWPKVTATYTWVIPMGEGLPPRTGSVTATMPFNVVS